MKMNGPEQISFRKTQVVRPLSVQFATKLKTVYPSAARSLSPNATASDLALRKSRRENKINNESDPWILMRAHFDSLGARRFQARPER